MFDPKGELRDRWFCERDEAIEHALEPRPGDRMQPQAANPEDRYYCDTLDRVLHPERYEDEAPWIPDPEDIAG